MGPVRNVDDLMAVGHGYQRAMILFAALKLGVFRGLAAGRCDASALARRVGADPGKLSILLDALAAQGLVGKKRGIYTGTRRLRGIICCRGSARWSPSSCITSMGGGSGAAFPARYGRGGRLAGVQRGTFRRTSFAGWRKTPESGRPLWPDGSSPAGGSHPGPRRRSRDVHRCVGRRLSRRGDHRL